nr:MAG TPA: hypothetical protein [Caudoviricetes sp.]
MAVIKKWGNKNEKRLYNFYWEIGCNGDFGVRVHVFLCTRT